MDSTSPNPKLPLAKQPIVTLQDEGADTSSNGFELFVRLIRFQVKLFLDGVRDLLLSPISIGAVIMGVVFTPRKPGHFYNGLMRLGRKSDRWINLFEHFGPNTPSKTVDEYLAQIEDVVRKDHAKGGVSAKTHERVNSILDRIKARTKPPAGDH